MTVLVPGGHGFLGSKVVEALVRRGIRCVVVSRRDGVDFRDFEATRRVFERERFDAVIQCAALIGGLHFVARHASEVLRSNLLMNVHLMEAARTAGVRLYVNPLSNCMYPARLPEHREEDLWSGALDGSVLGFGFAKQASLVQSLLYARQSGFPVTNLILPNMYGPGDYFDAARSHALGALIARFVEAQEKGLPAVEVWGDGTPIREWLFVEDAAELCSHVLDHPAQPEPTNVGIGRGIPVRGLAEMIREMVGYRGEIVFDASKPNGAPCKVMVVDRMKRIFQWTPRTSLESGIRRTIAWYRAERMRRSSGPFLP